MTDLADDIIPVPTMDQVHPAVLTGATLACSLLVSASLPTGVQYLSDIDSGDLLAVDAAEVVMSHSVVGGEIRLSAAPAEFELEDVEFTGAVWSFVEADPTWAAQATAIGVGDRIIRMSLFDDPEVIVGEDEVEVLFGTPLVIQQGTP